MKLTFECKTDEERVAAEGFLTWLCEQGEQDYWQWQENTEYDNDGDCTVVRFDYDWKKFSATCELGRVTKEE